MSVELEIEKKIILKRLPDIKYDTILKITQYYLKNNNNEWERYRKRRDKSDNKSQYFRTIKKTVRMGVCLEDEIKISKREFKEKVKICSRKISKTRYVKSVDDNLFWEIDVFDNISLVMAEIEIPNEDYEIIYPKWIQDNIISDVTGIKGFSNRRMSEKL